MSQEKSTRNISGKDAKGRFIIVGAGYAGLASAIELAQRGHEVELVESTKELSLKGDVFQLPSYATRCMSRWGDVLKDVINISSEYPDMTYFHWQGEKVLDAALPEKIGGFPILFASRALVQQIIVAHARSIGVKLRFGCRVFRYFEDEHSAGIYIGEERLEADAVIAADGVHSTARGIVTGKVDQPSTSGGAIYRSYFPLDVLANDPLTKFLVDSPRDQFLVWIGPMIHIIVQTNNKLQTACCLFTHRNFAKSAESWDNLGSVSEALELIKGWDPIIVALVRQIPADKLIDWQLLWRDPARPWISEKGRIALVGDAAHPHLPTSGAGAAQAIEDAATIGELVDFIGTSDIPLVFRTFEKLRFERTSFTQRLGWETRHRWHETDWEAVKNDPEILRFPLPDWLYDADAGQYAYDNAEAAMQSVKKGTPFVSTNVPKGHVHQEWTADDIVAMQKEKGKEAAFLIDNRLSIK